MKYMGSKSRFAKEILQIILKNRDPKQWYVEPFAGGMNVICEVSGKRIANDKNFYLIEMWKGLIENRERIYNIPKEIYDKARYDYNNKSNIYFDNFMIGWIGWMGSANGRFFDGGYSGKTVTKNGNIRDYIDEAIRNIEKQIPYMIGTQFENKDYTELEIPSNSIIYCDIPYQGTKQYSTSKNFNYSEFWDWCRAKAEQGHIMYVSEYNAPNDFECVWKKVVKSSLSANGKIGGNKISTEKLFKLNYNT